MRTQTVYSIDVNQTLVGADASKRNELYNMLRDEVLGSLRQSSVSRETIVNMKVEMRRYKKEMIRCQKEYDALL